jgi:hypothetical protein
MLRHELECRQGLVLPLIDAVCASRRFFRAERDGLSDLADFSCRSRDKNTPNRSLQVWLSEGVCSPALLMKQLGLTSFRAAIFLDRDFSHINKFLRALIQSREAFERREKEVMLCIWLISRATGATHHHSPHTPTLPPLSPL